MRPRTFAIFVPLLVAQASAQFTIPPAVRDIHVLKSYRPGKNSFVESTDRHAGYFTGKGFRFTVLDIKGTGSLRHIWSTWTKDGPHFEWQFFVDGETKPSLRGSLDQIVDAAARVTQAPGAGSSVPVDPEKRDYNLYLPVPFEKSLRIDLVQVKDRVELFFCQIDYRTGDDSLRGIRLRARTSDSGLEMRYEGWHPQAAAPVSTTHVEFPSKHIEPGERVLLGRASGPAIVRRLLLDAPIDADLRLKVRYDQAKSDAVDVPLRRYFGEFKGASFERISEHLAASYLPMPFRSGCEIYLENRSTTSATATLQLDLERVPAFSADWGYFHALYHQSLRTNGHHPHQVLYIRGRGQWLGMSLFNSGHDHGGGDFAVIDGESSHPAFLHGVNGEDYFTFAWFGRGQHQPYAQAINNVAGRYRHHFENPYVFQKSFQLEWGAFPGLRPETVAVWYQDSPEDTTVPDGSPEITETWDAFGPVPIPLESSARHAGLYAGLPSVADLDRGESFDVHNEGESFRAGWLWEETSGPSLNLTYLSRHGVAVNGEKFLGGNGHAFLARRRFLAKHAAVLPAWLSHDDPIEIELNGATVYHNAELGPGFRTRSLSLPIRAGENELVVRLTNYFNQTFNWTGFALWLQDENGRPVHLSDLFR